ncbi:hypothetical protein HDU96_005046, partial [Phlyctochytrium bullatum]
AVFDAIDSHIGMATGTADTQHGAAADISDLQKQIVALQQVVMQNSSRSRPRGERLNIVAFANSAAAVDSRGVPIHPPSKGASSDTRNRYVSKVMAFATDFLETYHPDIEPLVQEDEDDLRLFLDDPSALPEPLASSELFYTVEDNRPRYTPGFPSAGHGRSGVSFKDKTSAGSSSHRGPSPNPRPPTPGATAPAAGTALLTDTTDSSQADLIVDSELNCISIPSAMPFPE